MRAAELTRLFQEGKTRFSSGQYLEAIRVFESGYAEAMARGELQSAIRFQSNLGSCHFAMFQYRKAMQAYVEAKRLSQSMGDLYMTGGLLCNISSLYLQMGDVDAARQAAEAARTATHDLPQTDYEAQLQLQLAILRARQGDTQGAMSLLRTGIEEADRAGNVHVQTLALNELGDLLRRTGNLQAADKPLVESFRLRRLSGDKDIAFSYRNVAMLRMAEGDLKSASLLMDRAIETASHASSVINLWSLHYDRGRVRQRQGKLAEAFEEFRAALNLAARWRLEVLPVDSVRTGAEVELHEVYSSFIEAGNRLYLNTQKGDLARQTFRAAEENRAASLRALLNGPDDWQRRLPPEYWETLAKLQTAERALLRGDSADTAAELERLRLSLTEIETRTGLDLPASEGFTSTGAESELLGKIRSVLQPQDVLLSFHLGETTSYLWAIAKDDFGLYSLPPQARVARQVEGFQRALRNEDQNFSELGVQLYRELFGPLRPQLESKQHWILALDDVLFELPLAALTVGYRDDGTPMFLAERHSLQVTPNASMLASRVRTRLDGTFLGMGDAIYNVADPRWNASKAAQSTGWRGIIAMLQSQLRCQPTGQQKVQMPRLAGSGREITECARTWNADPSRSFLLTGREANRQRLTDALRQEPAVLHLATHVLRPEKLVDLPLIALGLRGDGDLDSLSPREIYNWRLNLGLVVLSGCSSGEAEALPGAGLMGMTRAWLAAGAGAVVATRWPTTDDSGTLFLSFYRHLKEPGNGGVGRRAAEALQHAQLDMLRSGSWRSSPKHWAAYFMVGKDL